MASDVGKEKALYSIIAEIHKQYNNDISRVITVNNDPPSLVPARYVVLADGKVDVFKPIADLFGLHCFCEMSSIPLKCPVVFRVNPGTQEEGFKCQVSLRRARDKNVKLFGESTEMSQVGRITSLAHIAGSMPEHTFEMIKSCTVDLDSIKWYNGKGDFSGNEVRVELYGLQLPCMEICALPGPRVEMAGGKTIEGIIKPYLIKENKMIIIVHLAHLPPTTSWSLGLLDELGLPNTAGLVVRNGIRDDTGVTEILSRGQTGLSLGWFDESSLDQLRSKIIYHSIITTIPRYVFVCSSITCS
jgi:hypothetical protein